MFYAIAIAALMLAAYWLWGMRKMVRMNNDPDQHTLTHLLVRAGSGKDEELLAFIKEQQWTDVQLANRVAHALTVAEKLYLADEYSRASKYAVNVRSRYRRFQDSHPLGRERLENTSNNTTPPKDVRPNAEHLQGSTVPTAQDVPVEPSNQIRQRFGFGVNEFIVYPAHGVGQILAIEEQEIAGAKLELFVINFAKDKMTLRVPAKKVANVGMRKLADPATIQQVYQTLGRPRHIAVGNWSRVAQEYEAKMNSGDIIAIAEAMRDLYRPAVNPGQGHSERQLYAAALDRLAREVAIVMDTTEEEAVTDLETLVINGAGRRS